MSDTDNLYSDGPGRFATARKGGIAEDAEFILAKRRAGVSVSAIARMVGRSEPDVAAICKALSPVEIDRQIVFVPDCTPVPKKPPKREACARGRHRPMPALARMYAEEMCAMRGVELAALIGDGRAKGVGALRQELYWRLSKAGYNNCEIGSFVGGRDPSTVRYGILTHQKRIDNDVDLSAWRTFGKKAA